jgi:hypothetical protein
MSGDGLGDGIGVSIGPPGAWSGAGSGSGVGLIGGSGIRALLVVRHERSGPVLDASRLAAGTSREVPERRIASLDATRHNYGNQQLAPSFAVTQVPAEDRSWALIDRSRLRLSFPGELN